MKLCQTKFINLKEFESLSVEKKTLSTATKRFSNYLIFEFIGIICDIRV